MIPLYMQVPAKRERGRRRRGGRRWTYQFALRDRSTYLLMGRVVRLRQPVLDWCQTHIGPVEHPLSASNETRPWAASTHSVFIRSRRDAVAFKLRWC